MTFQQPNFYADLFIILLILSLGIFLIIKHIITFGIIVILIALFGVFSIIREFKIDKSWRKHGNTHK